MRVIASHESLMFTRPMNPNDLEEVFAIEQATHVTPWTKDILRDWI
jgi:hypothetical protein